MEVVVRAREAQSAKRRALSAEHKKDAERIAHPLPFVLPLILTQEALL